jgi:hypothetical protein
MNALESCFFAHFFDLALGYDQSMLSCLIGLLSPGETRLWSDMINDSTSSDL